MLFDQDIEIGKAVRPQLALRVRDSSVAWKKVPASTHQFPSKNIVIVKWKAALHLFYIAWICLVIIPFSFSSFMENK